MRNLPADTGWMKRVAPACAAQWRVGGIRCKLGQWPYEEAAYGRLSKCSRY